MSLAAERSRLEPGYRLDRYELLCPIAYGGMASVWLARMHGKHGFEKLIAIKTILPQYASETRFQQMFLDEARIAAGIEHANVAQIFDLGEQHDILYIVMEWVDGDSLSKLHRAAEKRKKRIPLGVALRLLADTAGGLHAAHELRDKTGKPLGVVHRDISPQNILVSARGNAKLIDFGIAKALHRISGDTSTGFLKGKIQYMPPEQAIGRPIDHRADVWALGAVLYYLLAGVAPYDAENQLATLHVLTSGQPPPPLPSSVPPPVAALVMRAMAYDPAHRVADAAELQRLFEQVMVQCGVQTSTTDVARYVAEQMSDRAAARKRAVELALEAAAERQRVLSLLGRSSEDFGSGSGASNQSLPQPAGHDAGSSGGYPHPRVPPAPGSQPSDISALPPGMQPYALGPGHFGDGEHPISLVGSLNGSSAIAYPRKPEGTRLWAILVGVAGAVTVGVFIVIAFLAGRGPAAPSVAAGSGEAPSEAPSADTPPPPAIPLTATSPKIGILAMPLEPTPADPTPAPSVQQPQPTRPTAGGGTASAPSGTPSPTSAHGGGSKPPGSSSTSPVVESKPTKPAGTPSTPRPKSDDIGF